MTPLSTLRWAIDGDGIATVTFDAPGTRVNTMSPAWQGDLAGLVAALEREQERIAGVVLESAKPSFFAGADLRRLLATPAHDAAASFAEIEAMKASLRRLERLGRPVVSLLCGSALGGGWDVALAGHARFALADERLRFGSPEVTLGLVPGTGAITRTVRKLGLLAARPWLIEGRTFGPREAAELGWVDGLGDSADGVRAQARAWIADHPDAEQPWDRRDYRLPGGAPDSAKVAAALATLPAAIAQQTRGLYPAPQAILESMVEGALVDFDTALRIESRKLAKVMVGPVAKNMISAFFFDLNEVRAGASRGLADPEASRAHPFSRRLAATLDAERAAMRSEGVPAALIAHAALAVGLQEARPHDADENGFDKTTAKGSPPSPSAPLDAPLDAPRFALKQRLLCAMGNEALRCVRDGVVATEAEANIASIVGAGFPAWTGGAVRYMATEGRAGAT